MEQPLLKNSKINLGCGTDALQGFLNVDKAPCPGVDLVHDLESYPWPFPDNQFEEVVAIHLLEHLPNTIQTLEELYRIAQNEARIVIRVPYWNCWHSIGDPTHLKAFHQKSFDFFDPRKRSCRERPYYSKARFNIEKVWFWRPLVAERGWIRIGNPVLKGILSFLARYLNNIIWVLEFQLRVIKK